MPSNLRISGCAHDVTDMVGTEQLFGVACVVRKLYDLGRLLSRCSDKHLRQQA
jgi:hypothetical protein